MKSVNKASIGDDLVVNNYVNTAISNVRMLKGVTKDSRFPLAENLLVKLNDNFCNVEKVIFGWFF